ncbi:MAG TPA: TIGR03066 family protein [Gemmataceae bacterium]|nr:TIGR03066 family protein [Gemmataceae bacterium]
MNALKLCAAVAVVCLIGSGVRAEDKKADNAKLIVGKWEMKSSEGGLPKGTMIEFTKDGKVKVTVKMDDKENMMEGTYKVEGDKLMVAIKVGEEEHKQTIELLKLTDTEMHTKNEQGKMSELTKKK